MTKRYSIDEAIRAAVLGVPGVAALLAERVYADDAVPQAETFPYAVLSLITSPGRVRSLRQATKTVSVRYQVDFYGATKAAARSLATLVGARAQEGGLDGFRGTWTSGGASCYVQKCFLENFRHDSIDPASAQEARIYVAGFDAVIWFNE